MRAAAGIAFVAAAVSVTVALLFASQPEVRAVCAATPAPTATPIAKAKRPTRKLTMSVRQAVAAVARRVDVPVALPELPQSARLLRDPYVRGKGGQIPLRLPGRRLLTIQYGRAGFDGCGPSDPWVVKVGRYKGLYDNTRHKGRTFSTVVWPATPRNPDGRYGLSGEFSRRRILAMARSMAHRVAEDPIPNDGC